MPETLLVPFFWTWCILLLLVMCKLDGVWVMHDWYKHSHGSLIERDHIHQFVVSSIDSDQEVLFCYHTCTCTVSAWLLNLLLMLCISLLLCLCMCLFVCLSVLTS